VRSGIKVTFVSTQEKRDPDGYGFERPKWLRSGRPMTSTKPGVDPDYAARARGAARTAPTRPEHHRDDAASSPAYDDMMPPPNFEGGVQIESDCIVRFVTRSARALRPRVAGEIRLLRREL